MTETRFTAEELRVLCDRDFMPLKAAVSDKINQLFTELKLSLLEEINSSGIRFPEGLDIASGKFSRGENYRNFAWRVFDFPRRGVKNDLFIFRTLFLWGQEFSFHLILTGLQAEKYAPAIFNGWKSLADAGILLSAKESPWDWERSAESHREFSDGFGSAIPDFVASSGFIKLTCAISPEEYADVPAKGAATWRIIQNILFRS